MNRIKVRLTCGNCMKFISEMSGANREAVEARIATEKTRCAQKRCAGKDNIRMALISAEVTT